MRARPVCVLLFDRWASIVEITLRLANNRRCVTTTASRFHLAATYNFRCLSLWPRNDGARSCIIDIANIAPMPPATRVHTHPRISVIFLAGAWQCEPLWNSSSRPEARPSLFLVAFPTPILCVVISYGRALQTRLFHRAIITGSHFWPGPFSPLLCASRALIDRPASLINRMSLTWKTA